MELYKDKIEKNSQTLILPFFEASEKKVGRSALSVAPRAEVPVVRASFAGRLVAEGATSLDRAREEAPVSAAGDPGARAAPMP